MIPIHLKISGFLSYRDPVELDLSTLKLACISGANGAGKSSLLDAITWALFGQARKNDDSIINLQSKTAEVWLTFIYEGCTYRIQRSYTRGKSKKLEFQLQDASGLWQPLTEDTLTRTQAQIESILRLDYETFTNAAFFLQGKADQFATMKPTDRKRILRSILGLEIWDTFKQRATDKLHALKTDEIMILGQIETDQAELAEEPRHQEALKTLEKNQADSRALREKQEELFKAAQKAHILLRSQREKLTAFQNQLESDLQTLQRQIGTLAERQKTQAEHRKVVARAGEIEKTFKAYKTDQEQLAALDLKFSQYHTLDQERNALHSAIENEHVRLEGEHRGLMEKQTAAQTAKNEIAKLDPELAGLKSALEDLGVRLGAKEHLEGERSTLSERITTLNNDHTHLGQAIRELQEKIQNLRSAKGADCPFCGQPLTAQHIKKTSAEWSAEIQQKETQQKSKQEERAALEAQVNKIQQELAALRELADEQHAKQIKKASVETLLQNVNRQVQDWTRTGEPRLLEVEKILNLKGYAAAEQKQLATVVEKLTRLGYDADAHQAARQAVQQAQAVEADHTELVKARAALEPLEQEIAGLKAEIDRLEPSVNERQKSLQSAQEELAVEEAQTPDPDAAEKELFLLREKENQWSQEVGGAFQRVHALGSIKTRLAQSKKDLDANRLQQSKYKSLERAFGRDGVPALLIEQALPSIAAKTNDLLDRLTEGTMTVRFETQAEYKEKNRADLRETLDIQISDGAGGRAYELFSGGEAFRINFAIRLALSEELARRNGARLQTLVIDEGFGSQDLQGRQRLIEAINSIRNDFALILVITHLDELKDAFSSHIEVTKTERGSSAVIVTS